MGIRGKLEVVNSFFPLSVSEGSHSGYQAWNKCAYNIEPSHWPKRGDFLSFYFLVFFFNFFEIF